MEQTKRLKLTVTLAYYDIGTRLTLSSRPKCAYQSEIYKDVKVYCMGWMSANCFNSFLSFLLALFERNSHTAFNRKQQVTAYLPAIGKSWLTTDSNNQQRMVVFPRKLSCLPWRSCPPSQSCLRLYIPAKTTPHLVLS